MLFESYEAGVIIKIEDGSIIKWLLFSKNSEVSKNGSQRIHLVSQIMYWFNYRKIDCIWWENDLTWKK